jgi:peptide/nickel transport system substrate-binding protein
VKAALETTKSAATEAERKAAFESAQRQIAKDQVNVFLFMLPKIAVARKGLSGMWLHSPVPAAPIRDLSWN